MKWSLLFVPCLMIASGCIQVEQKLALNPDASGTFEVNYTVPDETTQRIKAMLKLADELAAAGGDTVEPIPEDDFTRLVFDPEEAIIRRRIESYAPLGLRLEELEVQARNARRVVKLRLAFTNIADIARADFFSSYGFSLAKNKAGQYVLYTRPITREPLDKSWAQSEQEAGKLMAPLLIGFVFDLRIQTPGRLISTNADEKEPYAARWNFAFDSDPQALAKLQRKQMQVVFDNTGLVYPEFRQPEPASGTTARTAPRQATPAKAPPTAAAAVTNAP